MRDRNQVVLPIDLEICIPKGDFVFKVVEICEKLDYTKLYQEYYRDNRVYEPVTLFEVLVYGYMTGRTSARALEEGCKTDIRFMWLIQHEPRTPSFNTFDRFKFKKLAPVIEDLFYQFVMKLYEMEEVNFKNVFVDGTKFEANANKYTHVWRTFVEKASVKLEEKISKQLPVIFERYGFNQCTNAEECYEALITQARWMNITFVKGKGKHKTQLQRDIEQIEGYLTKKQEYTEALGIFKGRKSFSKTDKDATFIHMKEDYYLKNGNLKPGYNIQIGVENEYIIGAASFNNRTDVQTLIPFLERMRRHTNRTVERVIADAGYESLENYLYLEENEQECYIKPPNYEQIKTRKYKNNPYLVEHMDYNESKDEYTCPRGRKLKFRRESTSTTANGYEIKYRHYSNEKCGRCPHKDKCHSSKNDYRTIRVNTLLREHRAKAFESIMSDEGAMLRMNRSIQVEGAFGVIKQDYGFTRFLSRGTKNIETEFFLYAIAFNFKKLCTRTEKGKIGFKLHELKVS